MAFAYWWTAYDMLRIHYDTHCTFRTGSVVCGTKRNIAREGPPQNCVDISVQHAEEPFQTPPFSVAHDILSILETHAQHRPYCTYMCTARAPLRMHRTTVESLKGPLWEAGIYGLQNFPWKCVAGKQYAATTQNAPHDCSKNFALSAHCVCGHGRLTALIIRTVAPPRT